MNIRELEYLVAVDEERHFHKAAARCFVSQPTLSGQLKKLEQELGVLLIERSNRRVEMTEVGKEVVGRARKVLAGINDIHAIAQTFHDPMMGDLRLGIIPTVAPYLLPIIMPELNKQFPAMKLWLYEYQTEMLLEKLRRSELDLLILALPIKPHEFKEFDLYREPFQLALKKGQALSNSEHITLSDIANREVLLLEEGHCLRGHVLDVCSLVDVTESAQFKATSLETLRHMVGEGMGMTLMPELAVPAKKTKHDLIQYLEFSDPKPNRRIGMLYRKNSYREEAFNNIAESIKSVLPVSIFF